MKNFFKFLKDNAQEIDTASQLLKTVSKTFADDDKRTKDNQKNDVRNVEDANAIEVESHLHQPQYNSGIKRVREGMSDKEENEFIDSLSNICPKDMSVLKSPEAVMQVFNNLGEAATEVMKFIEIQETKRCEIRAQRDVAIKKIEATTDLLKMYLDRTFDERRYIFEKQFAVVDHALATGNVQMLSMGLSSIQELAASSPFKALADISQVQKNLADPNHEFDI